MCSSDLIVARHSAADQILVQLPGVTDVARAKEIIRSTAQLELKQVEQGPFSDENAARQAFGNNVPPDLEILPGTTSAAPGQPAGTGYYVVRRVPAVTGRDLRNARPTLDENNRPAVSFSLNQDGARKFGNFTQANIGRQLAIVLDKQVVSAPVIESAIPSADARITASATATRTSRNLATPPRDRPLHDAAADVVRAHGQRHCVVALRHRQAHRPDPRCGHVSDGSDGPFSGRAGLCHDSVGVLSGDGDGNGRVTHPSSNTNTSDSFSAFNTSSFSPLIAAPSPVDRVDELFRVTVPFTT